ncbi:MAG: helix-turn-helix domain-containing protein [Tannerellaceae bacterium]|nr:helix-turn-helix domain-containing protein [Tannerellaceae bacterium]
MQQRGIYGLKRKKEEEACENNRDLYETGNRVMEIRTASNLTQEQLAEKMGVAGNTISRIETGVSAMRIDTLFRLCDELHVTPDMFCPERFYKNTEKYLTESALALMRRLNQANQKLVYDMMVPLISRLLETQGQQ